MLENLYKDDISLEDRYKGCLVGLACGDALGTTLEFTTRPPKSKLTDIVGGGPFNLEAGQWTDDTSMALCLASSLIHKKDSVLSDQLDRYLRWRDEGYMSSNGVCFDIGATVSRSLLYYENYGDELAGVSVSSLDRDSGNGSLMRLASIPMFYRKNLSEAILNADFTSKTTHGSEKSVDACKLMCSLIIGALNGVSKDVLLSSRYKGDSEMWYYDDLQPEIFDISLGLYKNKSESDIESSGYVVHSLEAAIWAFNKTDNFRAGALLVANLCGDADTTAAIYGQLAGAYYGYSGIPKEWSNIITFGKNIEDMSLKILKCSEER